MSERERERLMGRRNRYGRRTDDEDKMIKEKRDNEEERLIRKK